MRQLVLPCFAKVNWILKILGRRPDRFHELRTVYQTVDLCDEIQLEATRDGAISLEVQGISAPSDASNLVYRAAELVRDCTEGSQGVRLLLRKRIPVGAGLGGGSSDAALTLLGLNQLWCCGLSTQKLSDLAGRLGSDVAFFLVGGMALGEGRGEIVSPLPDRPGTEELILLFPRRPIATREAYQAKDWGQWKGQHELTNDTTRTTIQRLCDSRAVLTWDLLENDLEAVLLPRYPFLGKAAEALRRIGCKRVLLCGSGSTLMGVGHPRNRAATTTSTLEQEGDIFTCRTLSRVRYRTILQKAGLR